MATQQCWPALGHGSGGHHSSTARSWLPQEVADQLGLGCWHIPRSWHGISIFIIESSWDRVVIIHPQASYHCCCNACEAFIPWQFWNREGFFQGLCTSYNTVVSASSIPARTSIKARINSQRMIFPFFSTQVPMFILWGTKRSKESKMKPMSRYL